MTATAAERLIVGREATVRYETDYVSPKRHRWRGVFLGVRDTDGTLTFWTEYGYRTAPADAAVVVHRDRQVKG